VALLTEKIDGVNGHDATPLTQHNSQLEETSVSVLHTTEEIKVDSGVNGSAMRNSHHTQ
jgi:hypothetical protein